MCKIGMWPFHVGGVKNTFFEPRRSTENGNVNTFIHEGPQRGTKNCNGNFFRPRRTRRGMENGNGSFFLTAEGHEEQLC